MTYEGYILQKLMNKQLIQLAEAMVHIYKKNMVKIVV